METSRFLTLLNLHSDRSCVFSTSGLQLYEGIAIQVIKAMPMCKDTTLFCKALSRNQSIKYKIDPDFEEGKLNSRSPSDPITCTGIISIRYPIYGESSWGSFINILGVPKISPTFSAKPDQEDLCRSGVPIGMDKQGNLICQIKVPCSMEILFTDTGFYDEMVPLHSTK